VLTARLDAYAFELMSFLTLGQTLRQGAGEQATKVQPLPARKAAA
jgi:hypothetical protein